MAELLFLGPEVVFGRFHGRDDARNPFGDMNTVLFERLDLLRIIGHKAHRGETKKPQNRGGQFISAQVGVETQLLIRFHGVGAMVLQLVGAQLIEQTDSAAFLIFVDKQSPALLTDRLEREFKLEPAIAS
jgi:hypothetical protein